MRIQNTTTCRQLDKRISDSGTFRYVCCARANSREESRNCPHRIGRTEQYSKLFLLRSSNQKRKSGLQKNIYIDAGLILQTAKNVCTCPATVMGAVFFERLVSANHMHPTGRHAHGLARDVRGIRETNISALGVRSASDVLAPAVGIPNAMASRRSHLRSSRGEERHVAHKPNSSEDTFYGI